MDRREMHPYIAAGARSRPFLLGLFPQKTKTPKKKKKGWTKERPHGANGNKCMRQVFSKNGVRPKNQKKK